ncbi:hypothetical protein JYT97_02920 [Haliea sp. AH-315-K21]|uniref:Outer membrane protein beta-barrel domain-containing protein n=1 Tax=SAR86 cluster bacterium TaxID=2030880 RepID=A0A2A5CIW1_9GAMM|nr:hypothetical protein [Haliea sp. AH-315-K21]MBN4075613.1 hypothetical protein [Gammaproteobacteria bacterium AH-315-E17]PCJ43380.1 MAG: hypothetical protein COA71_00470 [SAR86 cluster bacterium]
MFLSTKHIALSLTLLATVPLQAQEEAHHFIQLNYVSESPDAEPINPEGIGILIRNDIHEKIFFRLEVEDLSDGAIDIDAQALALAYVINPHSPLTYHLAALIEHEDEVKGTELNHGLGKGLEFGFHAEFHPLFMLHAEASLIRQNSDEILGLELGLLYKFSEPFGINF